MGSYTVSCPCCAGGGTCLCQQAGRSYTQFTFTPTGFANGACACCTDLNSAATIVANTDPTKPCQWSSTLPGGSGLTRLCPGCGLTGSWGMTYVAAANPYFSLKHTSGIEYFYESTGTIAWSAQPGEVYDADFRTNQNLPLPGPPGTVPPWIFLLLNNPVSCTAPPYILVYPVGAGPDCCTFCCPSITPTLTPVLHIRMELFSQTTGVGCPCMGGGSGFVNFVLTWDPVQLAWTGGGTVGTCGYSISFKFTCLSGLASSCNGPHLFVYVTSPCGTNSSNSSGLIKSGFIFSCSPFSALGNAPINIPFVIPTAPCCVGASLPAAACGFTVTL